MHDQLSLCVWRCTENVSYWQRKHPRSSWRLQPHKSNNNMIQSVAPELPGTKAQTKEYAWRKPLLQLHRQQRMALLDIKERLHYVYYIMYIMFTTYCERFIYEYIGLLFCEGILKYTILRIKSLKTIIQVYRRFSPPLDTEVNLMSFRS